MFDIYHWENFGNIFLQEESKCNLTPKEVAAQLLHLLVLTYIFLYGA